jgi:hypothetical protein
MRTSISHLFSRQSRDSRIAEMNVPQLSTSISMASPKESMAAASSTMDVTAITYMGTTGAYGRIQAAQMYPSQPATTQKRALVVQARH